MKDLLYVGCPIVVGLAIFAIMIWYLNWSCYRGASYLRIREHWDLNEPKTWWTVEEHRSAEHHINMEWVEIGKFDSIEEARELKKRRIAELDEVFAKMRANKIVE